MAMHLISNPAVSCILFPANNGSQQIELCVSEDYAVGKLIRCGLDAVHGYSRRGQRIYDPQAVRQGILSIDDHVAQYKGGNAARKALAHQGHGNIGLNNWAVAYMAKPAKDLVVPAHEPMHERIYPCFVKRAGNPPTYDIQDLVFFCPLELVEAKGWQTTDWDPIAQAPAGARIVEDPDRELEDNGVYLPIWHEGLDGRSLSTCPPDSRIDWTGTGTRFVLMPRNCRGTVEDFCPLLVPYEPFAGDEGVSYRLGSPLANVEFAFFGIPVETLAAEGHFGGSRVAELIHYFYDLRHVLDLVGVGNPEFYLLEYELKKNRFAEARRLLGNGGSGAALSVDIDRLHATAHAAGASPAVVKQLAGFAGVPGSLHSTLSMKGYLDKLDPADITDAGDFCVQHEAPGSSGPTLHIAPIRNCYSYSFVGTVTDPGGEPYVLFAVTGGHGGQRPHTLGGRSVFGRPVRTSMDLETAVQAILNQQLTRLWPQGGWDCQRLLLLDQGGDVHQWIGTGNVNYVVGSSIDRNRLSALLAVLEP